MEAPEPFFHELRQLRIAQDISLEDISVRTRINTRFLAALEEGDLEILPRTYIRLFLRSYCREIGADPAPALDELEELLGEPPDLILTVPEDQPVSTPAETQSEVPLDTGDRGPARMRRDFITGAAIFMVLILIVFFARRAYQEPTGPVTSLPTPELESAPVESTPPPGQETLAGEIDASEQPVPPPPRTTSPAVVPVESNIELPDEYFTADRIVSHRLERVRLTPPVRLTLMARGNVVIQQVTDEDRGRAFNLTVAQARIWTIQDILTLRTTAIELLRGDLNGVPIDFGETVGLGALRVTPNGEYEVITYSAP